MSFWNVLSRKDFDSSKESSSMMGLYHEDSLLPGSQLSAMFFVGRSEPL